MSVNIICHNFHNFFHVFCLICNHLPISLFLSTNKGQMGKCTIQGIDWSFAQQRWIIEKDLSFQCLSLLEMSIPNFSSSLQSGPWSAFSQASTCTVSKLFFGCFGLHLWKCQEYVIYQENNDRGRNQLIVQKSRKFSLIATNWNESKNRKVAISVLHCSRLV